MLTAYINPWDDVWCEAWVDDPSAYATGSHWCKDISTGVVVAAYDPNPGTPFLGNSVEWIWEKATGGATQFAYANMWNAQGAGWDGVWHGATDYPYYLASIYGTAGLDVSAYVSGAWNITWNWYNEL